MSQQRLPPIDAARAIASQLIVLHHLAWYGPMGDAVRPLAPRLVDWLTYDARLAVQVFLVLGGFLAACALAPEGRPTLRAPLALIGRRYLRLAPPYLCAVGLAIGAGFIARALLVHESVPTLPDLAQVLANLLMLQDVLGIEALSAGAWYVAIDLQLYTMMVGLLWLASRPAIPEAAQHWLAPALVCALGCAALFRLGRDASLDMWGIHFFGAFALGAAAWWASSPGRSAGWAWLLAGVIGMALMLEWRNREAVQGAAALVLCVARRTGALGRWPSWRPLTLLDTLGRISYSVFVVHYPVCLVANALVSSLYPGQAWPALAAFLAAWIASTAAGALLYRWVEAPTRPAARTPAAGPPGIRSGV
jgi:peptidoglycan/LPS O-acetylase OafA/YrhL